ncbi:MAG: cyclopropane-fatty-acyl-phospholipid synthase family protein [Pseudotabrizicola sp.]|uniref:SAM-dependent methyltransferase n=1 Tax=Pseudotabrizicola sp. TaxID=2939647 RepID=UPI0027199140|nr:cyclopropane-fatty-acyl-phospholipid synthase family protein [Pseudotabrizicola sp.]MDO9638826.1 cyclopropane-fatty-acyl-phospholipid synthase family protein [Pseudotabrizicola sp.]
MWIRVLQAILNRGIRTGCLQVQFPDGSIGQYGPGPGVPAQMTLTDPDLPRRIVLNPQLALGEGYMDGALHFPTDEDLRRFLQIAGQNAVGGALPLPMRLAHRLRRIAAKPLMQWNPLGVSRRRVRHHYDIPQAFYALFLDEDLQYTCAYFRDDGMTLKAAQAAKMDHIAAKLCLQPGQRVLDIGCGWGGLAFYLAQRHGVHVTGITLSPVQLAAAQARAAALGLLDKVAFRLQDYRDVPDRFDRVVSVGMMEHVGVPQYQAYFDKIRAVLTEDGIGLIHFIGRHTPPRVLSPWFQKYIFPGGYAPAFSEVIPRVERANLVVTDLEVWRGHYERTLRHWQTRFRAQEPQVRAMFDDRFIRMWWWYLVAAEVSFTHMGMVLFQMQIAQHPGAVPRVREYLYPGTRADAGSSDPA